MDQKLIVLKLFLDELGIPTAIDTIDDRKRVQKAVYLGQRSGADLGYRFGWYVKGPYSTELAQDYYRLADAIASGEKDFEEKELLKLLRDKLEQVKPLMVVPADIPRPQEDWLELVSSVDYLQKVSKLNREDARKRLVELKPKLAKWFDDAEAQLKQVRLLS